MTSPNVIERDVSSSVAEFDASLRNAAGGAVSGGVPLYRVCSGDVVLEVEIAPGGERRIALLRLATLRVTYRFLSGSAAAQAALLRRLDRAMHRGGG